MVYCIKNLAVLTLIDSTDNKTGKVIEYRVRW